nr:hypothetical protein [Tanacetum cinerariifolium]
MDKENPWGKDGTGKDVELHLYRSMIGSLMYLTTSRPDIMFVVCACARHQVTPKECHLHAFKRIFQYLKGHPKLGLWYPKESPFDLVAFSDSDYGGASQDRKRLISWQCKKQTIVATSTTEAEYVATASHFGQVMWIQNQLLDYGGYSRHMTGNISYLSDYEPFDGGYVSFGKGGCKITGKGTIKTGKLEFENVYFVKDLKDFKLLDDAKVLLRTPRQHNIYSIDLNNIVPHKDLTCLVAKASADEGMLWNRRLGHLNFKIMNKLVRHNLVKGLPSKCFENDHTCTACLKGKQHKASCKSKLVNSVNKSIHTLHIDLSGPTSDETSGILRKFITEIENLKDLKVKIIRCDNWGEFRNKEMDDFCSQKGIKREFSNARTPQQNGVAERRNRTLIEAARTMLADTKLPVTFWAEAVNTACYVQNKVLVNKSHNKTPYELFNGTNSTNFSCTKDAASQEVKKYVSSLRYIALPNWVHDALLESSSNESNGVEVDVSNMETTITASPTPTLRIYNDHTKSQIIGPVDTPIQTRNKSKEVGERKPKKIFNALQDPSWVEAMQEELLQFKIQNVYTLVDCPKRVRPNGIKWVLKNKKDERGIAIRKKARLDPKFPARVYKVEKAMYGLHQAPRAWHQVTPKECYMHAVKRIFRYLKGHPKMGLWYPKESSFDLVTYSDSDYGGATQDHKSTTRGCQFLGRRLISWQCKKQTIVATSTTEAEYVAAASCCRQVLSLKKPFDAGRFQYVVIFPLTIEPLGTPTEPHHTPSPEAQQTLPTTYSSPTLPPISTAPIPTVTPFDTPHLRQYTRRARNAQSSILPPVADEPASPLRDVSQGEEAAERVSDDTAVMATILTSMDAATVLASGVVEVPTGSDSIPTAGPPAAEVPTGSDVVPTAGLIFTTATVVTPYTRRKGRNNSQQRKPLTKKQHREFYTSVLRNQAGWKAKDFKEMTLEEIKEKFDSVWKQIHDFIPIGSKEEAEREDLNQLWALVKESLNIRPASSDKEMEL